MLDSTKEINVEKMVKISCSMQYTETEQKIILTAKTIELISGVKILIITDDEI